MFNDYPEILINAFETANTKFEHFVNTCFADNMTWLKEIEDAAIKAFGSTSITLLPKTPSMKRKRPNIFNLNEIDNQESPMKLASTFVDGVKKKKFKIEDMSEIMENVDLTASDASALNTTSSDVTLKKGSRRLRSRQKVPAKSLRKSKRIAGRKSSVNYYESPIPISKNESTKSSTVISIPGTPVEYPSTSSQKVPASLVVNEKLESNASQKKLSPVLHVQPKVAALIEKLHMSAQKFNKNNYIDSPMNVDSIEPQNLEDVQMKLFKLDSPIIKITKCSSKVGSPSKKFNCMTINNSEKLNTPDQITPNFPCIPTPGLENLVVKKVLSSDITNVEDKHKVLADKNSSSKNHSTPNHNIHHVLCQQTLVLDDDDDDDDADDEVTESQQEHLSINNTNCEYKVIDETELEEASKVVNGGEQPEIDTTIEVNIDQNPQLDHLDEEVMKDTNDKRRETYKVIVTETELPAKSTPKRVTVNTNLLNENGKDSPRGQEQFLSVQPESKGPKIVKPIKFGNIVTGISSFIKKNKDTPKKETEEERRLKKAAELEKKENMRAKNLEDGIAQKQMQREKRKIERMEREKRFADQLKRRQEEDERKRKILEYKAKQMSKNKEAIRKQKELEEEKKREIRELKRAEADARRQEEEEQRRQRALRQIEEEEKRLEALQRKAEYEKQERLRKKAENERLEKERLKALEDERIMHEERKKREFEEKERHRLEVERKLKEQREEEKSEKQKQEERMRAAVEEIDRAKKNETTRTDQLQPCQYCVKYKPPKVPTLINESVYANYDIDDLSSGDDTDDDTEPEKRVPSWAQGVKLKTQLTQQYFVNIDPDLIFVNCMESCRLDKIFQKKKERYFKRTSSAHWTSPIMTTAYYGR